MGIDNVTEKAGWPEAESESNPFDFDAQDAKDLRPREIRGIKWRSKEYVLRPASADTVIEFNNMRFRHAKMDDGSLVGVSGGAELPWFLVSRCLFQSLIRADGTEQLAALNQQTIKSNWPPHYVDKLFQKAKELSHIDDDNRTLEEQIKDAEERLLKLKKRRDKETLALTQKQAEKPSEGEFSTDVTKTENLVEVETNGDPVGN